MFNYQKTYVIKITATDKLSTWTKEYSIGIGIPNFSIFPNTIMINGVPITELFCDLLWPIGSVYMTSDSSADPASLFGGTWESYTPNPYEGVYMWRRTA